MQFPLQLHLVELKFRIYYALFSFAFSLIIILSYNEAIFFLETYIFTYLYKKNFIATHITELFTTTLYASLNLSFIAIFPYTYSSCKGFLVTGWYKSQTWFFSTVITHIFSIFFLGIFFSYFFILPHAFLFFHTWETTLTYALKIYLEMRIEAYTYWTFKTAYILSNLIFFSYLKLLFSYLMDDMLTLHLFFRKNKKYFLFFVCFLISTFIPPDIFLQTASVFIVSLIIEIFFFITCVFFAKNNV